MENLEEKKETQTDKEPKIKKEVITREIHQWRKPDGQFAEREDKTNGETSVAIPYPLKDKLKQLRTMPTESYRSVIERLVKEHYILQILKTKLIRKKKDGDMPARGMQTQD